MTAQTQLIRQQLDRLAIRAEAPCRLDLAGGSLDIHPLCVMEAPTLTINVAIELLSRADLRVRTDGQVVIRSEDLGVEVRYESLEELANSKAETELDLIVHALRFWGPPTGLELTLRSEAPKGSGLGASSALLVAVLTALSGMYGGRYGQQEEADNIRLVSRAQAIEAKHLGVPTGSQDHIAAVLGGPLVIQYDEDGPYVEQLTLPASIHDFLERHLLVLFTGQSHLSASPNWQIVRSYIDGDEGTRKRIEALKGIAKEMLSALQGGDRSKVCELINRDWEVRRELADGVTTPELDLLVAAVREAGADAARPTGAGGGGSLLVFAAPETHSAIVQQAAELGATRLAVRLASTGVRATQLHVEPPVAPLEPATLAEPEPKEASDEGSKEPASSGDTGGVKVAGNVETGERVAAVSPEGAGEPSADDEEGQAAPEPATADPAPVVDAEEPSADDEEGQAAPEPATADPAPVDDAAEPAPADEAAPEPTVDG